MRPRIFVTQPVAETALARMRKHADVTVNPDASRIIAKKKLIAAVRRCDILFSLLHDRIDRDVIAANPRLRAVTSQSITSSANLLKAVIAKFISPRWISSTTSFSGITN